MCTGVFFAPMTFEPEAVTDLEILVAPAVSKVIKCACYLWWEGVHWYVLVKNVWYSAFEHTKSAFKFWILFFILLSIKNINKTMNLSSARSPNIIRMYIAWLKIETCQCVIIEPYSILHHSHLFGGYFCKCRAGRWDKFCKFCSETWQWLHTC